LEKFKYLKLKINQGSDSFNHFTHFEKKFPFILLQAIAAGGLDLDLGKHVLYYDYNGYFPREKSGLKVRKNILIKFTAPFIT